MNVADLSQTRYYLSRVVPWSDAGYTNIHYTVQGAGYNKPQWRGKPVKSVDEGVNQIQWLLAQKDVRDIYICLSQQREVAERTAKSTGNKFLTAVRSQQNAVALKALFLDIDIKEPPKGYGTIEEAGVALRDFLAATGLPRPSMVVASGGGLHVYFTLAHSLAPAEWQELANALAEAARRHGLKIDEAVTVDSARILRPPSTWNCKLAEKRLVKLAVAPVEHDYDVEQLRLLLEPYKVAPKPYVNGYVIDAALFPPRTPITSGDRLGTGIDMINSGPMSEEEVRACLEAIPNDKQDWEFWNSTGMRVYAACDGQDYGLFLWKVWSAPHAGAGDSCDDRWATYHHSPPTRTGAGALVVQARTALGNPNWLPPKKLPQQVTASSITQDDMPEGYHRRHDGIVMGTITVKNKEGELEEIDVPVLDYPLTDPWVQSEPWVLHFTTTTKKGAVAKVALFCRDIGAQGMRKEIQDQGVMLPVGDRGTERFSKFAMAWIQKLQNTHDAVVTSSPFGWHKEGSKVVGFVYGGRLWTPAGMGRQSANPSPVTAKKYAPTGELSIWKECARLVTDQKRPALDAILASAFAAPLVKFTGEKGLLLSAYSSETGIGKSSALSTALAVWGNPHTASMMLDDTSNLTFNRLGELRSLPMYWDELRTQDQLKKFVGGLFRLTGGREKARLGADAKPKESGEWLTLMAVCTNLSVLDAVIDEAKTTTAGVVRVFEYEVEKVAENALGQIDMVDHTRSLARLTDNFGQAGLAYAEFLGKNHDRCDREVGEIMKEIGEEVELLREERFWISMAAVLTLGARYGNELGLTDIDEVALREFMVGTFKGMRRERAEQSSDIRDPRNVENILTQFLSEMRARHTIYTDIIHQGRGRPSGVKVYGDTSKLEGIYVQIALDHKTIRISQHQLNKWMMINRYPFSTIKKALVREFGAKFVMAVRMGAGTTKALPTTEHVLDIDLAMVPGFDDLEALKQGRL